jgi:hypothetical protein
VSHKKLEEAWQACRRAMPISPILKFTPEGLVLGAGTVVVAAEGMRQLESLHGRESHVLALLSAAYGKAVPPSVIGNIKRAAKAWSEGDDCLAYIHLAHARLPMPTDSNEAAHRLFIVDGFMKGGTSPHAVFEALRLSSQYIDAIEKFFNPDEPRVPVGSGRTSGEWTRYPTSAEQPASGAPSPPDAENGAGAGSNPAQAERTTSGRALAFEAPLPAAAQSFRELLRRALSRVGSAIAGASLSGFARAVLLRAGGFVTTAFGILLIPSSNKIEIEGDVPEMPGLHYSWKRDEAQLRLTYNFPGGGQRTFAAYLDGDVFRDDNGEVIGHVIDGLKGNKVAIYLAAVFPHLVKSDEPRLCPAYEPDVSGSDMGRPYDDNRPRQYEDFVKKLINPPPTTTPSGYVYYLLNSKDPSDWVSYDDCHETPSLLFEIKADYDGPLSFDQGRKNVEEQFLSQSAKQIAASGGRPVVWIFAEEKTAIFTRELFDRKKEGRQYITIVHVPWIK